MFLSGMNSPIKKNFDKPITSDDNFEDFQHSLTEEKIKQLNLKFKQFEKKGFIIYKNYFISMKSVFSKELLQNENDNEYQNILNSNNSSYSSEKDSVNYSSCFDEIYDLIFKRFREIKCIIKNNKSIFYLTDFKKENYISTFNVLYALTIFLKTSFENKIKLLFYLTDIDEDGYLNKNEIIFIITTINQIFVEEVSTFNTNSSILSQSLINLKVNNILCELFYDPGNLYNKIIEENNYVTFDIFYESIKKVKNYKYRIIPCFISFKDSLFSLQKEKMINVKEKHKKDFINISSALALEQKKKLTKYNYKSFSFSNLNEVITPIKINRNFNNQKVNRYKNLKLGNSSEKFKKNIKLKDFYLKSDISLKELIKNSTIFDENEKNKTLHYNSYNEEQNSNKNNNFFQYGFLANFREIKNNEVEPGLIKFLPDEIIKKKRNKNNIKKMNKFSSKRITPNIIVNQKNKDINLLDSLNEILENDNKAQINRIFNKHNSEDKYELKSHLKDFKHYDSISTKITRNFSKINLPIKHSNSINIRNKKRNKLLKYSYEKYKTLEEILTEIKSSEKIFNFDHASFINKEIIKKFRNIQSNMIEIKNKFKFINEKKKNSSELNSNIGNNNNNLFNFRKFINNKN